MSSVNYEFNFKYMLCLAEYIYFLSGTVIVLSWIYIVFTCIFNSTVRA